MPQDQELIDLQKRLAYNLAMQEETQKVIAEQEQILYNVEVEQSELEKLIQELQGTPENVQGNEESFNIILNNIANEMLQGINIELDKNEQGETIQ